MCQIFRVSRVLRFAPFANRLSYDGIPPDVQQLRCRTNFEALKFEESIDVIGQKLVRRMMDKSSSSGGKYIAVHLRFEKVFCLLFHNFFSSRERRCPQVAWPFWLVEGDETALAWTNTVTALLMQDMVAFSCCIYDGGEEEKKEMDEAREVGWRGKFTRPGRVIRPAALRRDGKCPLTPVEVRCNGGNCCCQRLAVGNACSTTGLQLIYGVFDAQVGMMLRGMGFKNDTPIFLASGKIYNAERFVAPLRQMFPALQTKETLLSADEVAQFKVVSFV